MSGWIKLYRGFRNTDGLIASKVFSDVEAWLWLLENAAWKRVTRATGKGEAVTLDPGQIHVSDRSLATAFGWDRKRISRFLARLEAAQKCRQSRGQSGTIITIENWAKYQGNDPDMGPVSGPAEGQLGATHKEGKERKEEKNITPATPLAFEGRVIKLTETDFKKWQHSFHAIDLPSALQSRDDWLATQADDATRKRWFISTSNWLATKNSAAVAARNRPAEISLC